MNFYSLDGSKMDSNNLFENKQIYENFNNIGSQQNKSSSLDNAIDEDEEFASVPTSKSSATDTNFQCSDGYVVKGSNLGNEFKNSNLNDCKKMCVSAGTDCIGFNFNTKNNVCTLKKNASSMDNNNNSTLCIKKSAGNAGCKVNTNQQNKNRSDTIKAFNELDSIFNEQSNPTNSANSANSANSTNSTNQPNQPNQNQNQNTVPGSTPNSINPNSSSNTNTNTSYPMDIPVVETVQENLLDTGIETKMENKTMSGPNMGNNPPGVYVDLDCFMKNINVLQNHTDNMMIDLSLLLSNIKSCSYVKKTLSDSTMPKNKKMDSKQLLEQITSKINIPQPDTVQLKNIKADVLVSSGANTPSQILEVAKEPNVLMNLPSLIALSTNDNTTKSTEPFTTDETKSSNWDYKDLVLIVIIGVLIYLLVFRK